MTPDQVVVLVALGATFALFLHGRWRYDLVAAGALLALVFTGVVPESDAFRGFGHPAVITVAAVLVVSRGLRNSGVVDVLAGLLLRAGARPTAQVAASSGLVAASSAFMNNVGALALFLPVVLRVSRELKISPSTLMMPLAFGSLLGGLATLIGTPPNVIIALARADATGEPFRMFDFTPVGGTVALVGVVFIALVGWRLIPSRTTTDDEGSLFDVKEYVTEMLVPPGSSLIGKTADEIAEEAGDLTVAALVRGDRTLPAPRGNAIQEGDTILLRADSDTLRQLLESADLQPARQDRVREVLGSEAVTLVEAVVTVRSWLIGESPTGANLHRRFGVNILAISRHGARIATRIGAVRLRPGDVLLMQAPEGAVRESLERVGLLPLAPRGFRLRQPPRVLLAILIFGVALVAGAAFRLIAIEIAVTAAAGAMVLAGMLTVDETYEAIEWPVIILLGAMIPVGGALETTGLADLAAQGVLSGARDLPVWGLVTIVLVATMFLSDLVNNAAAAILMAPIAVNIATGSNASVDPFLMAVALGASCAFLTPIGHQSNVLVMGPGGYRFGDYWRLGLPVEGLIVVVGVPLIMLFWAS